MKVWFVGAGPGDPELLTVKARRLLEAARCCIWAGSLVNPEILALVPVDCAVHDSAGMDLEAIMAAIADCREREVDVVRLHTGEPALYGAIGEQMRRLDEMGIACEIVPGISAFQAAAAALRVELTAPEVAQTVVLTRTPGRTPMPPREKLDAFAATGATLCLYLSTGKLAEVCAALSPHYGADCPAALVFHASWPDEQFVRAPLAELPQKAGHFERTAVILVGRALGTDLPASRLYERSFGHGYRKGEPS